jgi:simple sugar transport system ATP-binding protein
VEIIKLLYRGTDILILDEPTAVLTPQEVRELFDTLRKMAASGKAIVIITHKLSEVMVAADWITVLRDGKVAGKMKKIDTNKDELAYLMVGRDIAGRQIISKSRVTPAVLQLDNITVKNDKGLNALNSFSLTVNGGEILGIAGVAGNGQKELAEAIAGLRTVEAGCITLNGVNLTNAPPKKLIKAGLSLIPEDRMSMGLVGDMNITENILLKKYMDPGYNRHGFLDHKKVRIWAKKLVDDFQIKTAGLNYPIKTMSVGNQQKLLLSREISQAPLLIVASYPSRGLDVGAAETVQNILIEQRGKGVAIILISEDLEEILKLSDRVAVLFGGRLIDIVATDKATYECIGKMMLGALREEVIV